MSEISPMVTMLAERMRTNPEDFVWGFEGDSTKPKFTVIMKEVHEMIHNPKENNHFWYLTDVEKKILIDAYRNLCRKRFEDECMQRILEDKQEHTGPASVKYKAQGRYQTGWNDPRIHLNSTQIEYCAKYGIDPEAYAKLMATTHT